MGTERDFGNMLNQKYVTKRPGKKPNPKRAQKSPWLHMGRKKEY